MAWPPMSDRENGLGWHVGAEVKHFGKDVMETHSSDYGFIFIGQNVKCCEFRGQPVGKVCQL